MEKILILGSQGTLGQALVEAFSSGNDVIALDRGQIDVTAEQEVRERLRALNPNLVINATAYNAVDLIETNETARNLARSVNGMAVAYLATACSSMHIALVHYSTNFVFDGENENGYKEDDIPHPINTYGESKRLGEELLIKHSSQYYLIRLSRLFGRKGASESSKLSFVDLMFKLAITDKKNSLDLADDEINSPTYAPDLAIATRRLVESQAPFGTYHLTNDGSCTAYTFAKTVFHLANIPMTLNPVNSMIFHQPAKRPKSAVLMNTKLKKLRPWQEALNDYLITILHSAQSEKLYALR
jgi:dTDP-4-dehydrorhamnose reductase